jgi:hypothetical protein
MTPKALAVPILALSIWLASPLAQAASYRIQLKNGREFRTNRVLEDGAQIRFSLKAGTMGVPIDAVHAITEVGGLSNSRATREPAAQRPAAPLSSPQELLLSWTAAAEARTLSEEAELPSNRVKKTVLQRVSEAMREVAKKMVALAEAAKAKSNGILPAWWND